MTTNGPAQSPLRPAPLGAVQSLVFLASMGTGVFTIGIFFIAQEGVGFGPVTNFWLSLVLGATYIAGASGVGPVLRRVASRYPGVSTRSVTAALSVAMGLASLAPPVVGWLDEDLVAPMIWVSVALYALAAGAFWPVIESYLGGGRSGERLRRAIGQFNVIWALAVVVSQLAIGLLVKAPLTVLAGFGVIQLLSTAILIPMGAEPARHVEEHHKPPPLVYAHLLKTFRLLLPTSYFVVGVWSPYAPQASADLGIAVAWQAPVAATWMFTRWIVFATLERWHGWHGRWWLVALGTLGLIGGIGVALAAPLVGGAPGLVMLIAGLGALGVANGAIYTASLYYAMEVGRGEVEAGGTHEALIGIGFAAGPVTGLLAAGTVSSGVLPGVSLGGAMLIMLGLVLGAIGVLVSVRVRASRREVSEGDPEGRSM